jgi:hypothetical protein
MGNLKFKSTQGWQEKVIYENAPPTRKTVERILSGMLVK